MPSKREPASPALEALRAARLTETKERITRLKRENAQAARNLVLVADVDRLLLQIASRQRALLLQATENDLPARIEGLTAAQIRPIMRTVTDGLCEAMATLVQEFEWQGPPRLPDEAPKRGRAPRARD